MELIFGAALCSVAVSIFLKWGKSHGFDALQMIAVNYAVASVLCYIWFKPDFSHVSLNTTPWWLIFILGMLLPGIFLCLARSLQYAGILKTEIAQRLSVVLSLLAAFSIFQEQFSISKLLGIGLGIVAVISLLFGQHFQEKTTSDHKKGLVFLLSVWIGYALVDILLKYTTGLGLQFALALNLAFLFSFVLSSSFLVLQKNWWSQKNILAGSGLGLLNFCNIALYIKAHMLLKDSPAIVFAGMNILVVLLGVMSGLLYFKEKLNLPTLIGLILGLTGVICLAYAM